MSVLTADPDEKIIEMGGAQKVLEFLHKYEQDHLEEGEPEEGQAEGDELAEVEAQQRQVQSNGQPQPPGGANAGFRLSLDLAGTNAASNTMASAAFWPSNNAGFDAGRQAAPSMSNQGNSSSFGGLSMGGLGLGGSGNSGGAGAAAGGPFGLGGSGGNRNPFGGAEGGNALSAGANAGGGGWGALASAGGLFPQLGAASAGAANFMSQDPFSQAQFRSNSVAQTPPQQNPMSGGMSGGANPLAANFGNRPNDRLAGGLPLGVMFGAAGGANPMAAAFGGGGMGAAQPNYSSAMPSAVFGQNIVGAGGSGGAIGFGAALGLNNNSGAAASGGWGQGLNVALPQAQGFNPQQPQPQFGGGMNMGMGSQQPAWGQQQPQNSAWGMPPQQQQPNPAWGAQAGGGFPSAGGGNASLWQPRG